MCCRAGELSAARAAGVSAVRAVARGAASAAAASAAHDGSAAPGAMAQLRVQVFVRVCARGTSHPAQPRLLHGHRTEFFAQT